ncbi:hypothetical protein M0R45_030397 [Rubus argutus]|uniref:Cytochrome P450 n=1 Tax=Rubus argutus TaxID=59490 RepID=A0AAW1WD39_RUBAR
MKILGNGLGLAEGEHWAKLRKVANHAFHGESLKNMIPDMVASVETDAAKQLLEGKNIFDMLNKLCSLLFKNSYKIRLPGISKLFKTSDEIEGDKVEKEIRNNILEIVQKREKKAVTEKEDSFGTRKEVLQLFGKQNPNPDGIAKLKTMNMIINEALRLYPPVIQLSRKTGREVRLGKLVVPANVQLVIPTVAFTMIPQIWGQDAQLFKPERFSEGLAKATKDNMAAFLPFGMGPRICVGFNFATTKAKIALSMILQRHSFTLSPGYVHSPLHFLTVRPQHGVQVILHSL